jgi:HAD superfamily hydrolase (TIGR01509 family)
MKKVPKWEYIQKNYSSINTLIWDMDGTLIPTEPIHEDAFLIMGKRMKVSIPTNADTHFTMQGMADEQVYEIVKNWKGFPNITAAEFIDEKNKILLEIIPQLDHKKYIDPEIIELINNAKKNKCQTALVTSSEKILTQAIFDTFNLHHLFEIVLTRQDVINPKPHPEPYLKAMNLLKKQPTECLIFEDSPTGLNAAKACGAKVVKAEWWY